MNPDGLTLNPPNRLVFQLRKSRLKIGSPHLWIILMMIVAISFAYYPNYGDIRDIVWLDTLRIFEHVNHINGIFYYVPIIYTAIIFGWIEAAISWLLSMLIILPKLIFIYGGYSFTSIVSNSLVLTIPVLIVLLITILTKWLEKEKEIYRERELVRQTIMSQILKTQEDERKRIAQELHDDTIQTLLAIGNRMQYLLKKNGEKLPEENIKEIMFCSDSIHNIAKSLRKLCMDLRPSTLDDLGLVGAIRSLVNALNDDSFKTQFVLKNENRRLPSEIEVTVYRFIQEALNNAKRHSEGTEAIVELEFSKKLVMIKVKDNGKGFVMPKSSSQFIANKKLGIIGMQERANLLGGNFIINSQLNKGTSVSLELKA